MKLAPKILAPLIGLAMALIVSVGFALMLQNESAIAHRRADLANAQMIEASEVRALSRSLQRDALKLLLPKWEASRKGLEASIEARGALLIRRSIRLVESLDPAETEIKRDFGRLQEAVVREVGAVKALVFAGDRTGAEAAFIERLEPVEKAASKLTDAFIDRTEQAIRRLTAEADRLNAAEPVLLVGLSGVSLLLAFGLSLVLIYRGVVNPMLRLTNALARISRGDYASGIGEAERRDEIGFIARGLDDLRRALAHGEQLKADQRARDLADATGREAGAASLAQTAREQVLVVRALGEGLEKLSAGDLKCRVETKFPDDYDKLRHDFNAAIASLGETMSVIAGNGHGIRAGADQMSEAADELSRRTEQQAASLEQTAAALDELTTTVRRTAEGAQRANNLVSDAANDARHSGRVVEEAVTAMGAIAASAQEIGNIIGVIDEIAFQTNLLALNAGVEAARAGESGRGFAVVAQEVRALAQRSAEAAKQISGLISTSSKQVASGVTLVGETGRALTSILARVDGISAIVTEIAASAAEQATGLAEVNMAVNEMDQATQQNAAMVQESTSASHSLARDADQMNQLIGRFRVDETRPAARRPHPGSASPRLSVSGRR